MDLNRLKKSIPDTRWMTIDTQLVLRLIAVVEAAKEAVGYDNSFGLVDYKHDRLNSELLAKALENLER